MKEPHTNRDETKGHPLWRRIDSNSVQESINITNQISLRIQKGNSGTSITLSKKDGDTNDYRFIAGIHDSIFVAPILPDLPLVIKPKAKLSILPGNKLESFIQIPLFLHIGAGKVSLKHTLLDLPIIPISKSFFGSPESGEVAYFIESPLHESIKSYESSPIMAYSPVNISNKSNQILHFERMILRVPNLSLYETDGELYTSPVSINFKGQDQLSQINIKSTPPKVGEEINLLAHPRKAIDKNIIKKSFYFMKSIYGS